MRPDPDRHQPLPGLLALPGHLLAKLSPRGRRRFRIAAACAGAGLVTLAVILVPRIQETKRERERLYRIEAARNLAERRRALEAEQRPRRGVLAKPGPSTAALEQAIVDDVARRVRAGDLRNSALRTECRRLPVKPRAESVAYSCTAVTSDIPANAGSSGGIVGYPYRASLDLRTGRFALCKVAGRPGEGSYTGRAFVRVPRACTG